MPGVARKILKHLQKYSKKFEQKNGFLAFVAVVTRPWGTRDSLKKSSQFGHDLDNHSNNNDTRVNTTALCAGIKQGNIPTTVDRYVFTLHCTLSAT